MVGPSLLFQKKKKNCIDFFFQYMLNFDRVVDLVS